MNLEQQEEILADFHNTRMKVMNAKSNDYASDKDVLDNFKNVAAIVGVTPAQQCLSLIAVKVARIGNLLSSGKKPSNEALEDSVLDMANYTDLLYCILKEGNIKHSLSSRLEIMEAIAYLTPHIIDFTTSNLINDKKELTPEEVIKKFNEQPLMYNDKPIEEVNEYNIDGSDLSLLEDNTWYIYPNGATQFNIEKGVGYGLTFDGSWVSSARWLANKDNSFYRKATTKEIKSALIKGFVNRGFVFGNEFKEVNDDKNGSMKQMENGKVGSDFIFENNSLYTIGYGKWCVFKDGQWAEIISKTNQNEDTTAQ